MNRSPFIDYKEVLSLFLTEELLDYFDITDASDMGSYYMLCLLEKNVIPEEHANLPLVSKGFHKPVSITDFLVWDRNF